jgi:signal transduction histidine kinase
MRANASITRQLTFAVLLIEFVAALILIAIVGNHERHVQFSVFKANLQSNANILFGALQEAEEKDGSIALDRNGIFIPAKAVYSVSDSGGTVLAAQGSVPFLTDSSGSYVEKNLGGQSYLFFVQTGERAIDPGKPIAVYHHVRIVYGLPTARVWHEIFEAVRFFAIATLLLLGVTAFVLTWLTRGLLLPIRQLAVEADKISSDSWNFNAPASSKRLVELSPLASAIETSIGRLQRSFEQQRRFTSDAAHELKTDLAIIKSSLQLLSMKQRTIEEYEKGLSLGLDDIGRLEATVQKMLTLARLEQTSGSKGQSCDFATAVLEAVAQSDPFARVKGVKFTKQLLATNAVVLVSREDAVLLCSNILVNALQHSHPGEIVEIATISERGCVSLSIRDHGAGVAEQDQPFLFDPFYRGDASRSRKTGGTGLGLSISKAICERAGGRISIGNHPTGGALVEIELPEISRNTLLP